MCLQCKPAPTTDQLIELLTNRLDIRVIHDEALTLAAIHLDGKRIGEWKPV